MEEEVRFLYSVYPKKPIKGILENGRPINSGKSLNLTIDQVKACMLCGTVYRWFANENKLERVTSLNIERLHNEKFMTEEEFAASKFDKVAGNVGSVIETKVEESAPIIEEVPVVEEVAAPAVEEAPVEEVKVEEVAPVEEEKIEEAVTEEVPVVEEVEAAPVAEETEAVAEEVVAEENTAEAEDTSKSNNFQTSNYKKKKH